MNRPVMPSCRQAIAIALLVLLAIALIVPVGAASESSTGVAAVVPAFSMMDVVGNRTRMIQFSLGAVAVGIAMLWWGNKAQ